MSAVDRRRRELLRRGFLGMGMLATGRLWLGCGTSPLDLGLSASPSGDAGGVGGADEGGRRTSGPLQPPPPGGSEADAPMPPARRDAGPPPRRRDAGRPPARDPGPPVAGDAGLPRDAGARGGADGPKPKPKPNKPRSILSRVGPLGDPDENGVRLPAGFRSRVIAHSGQRVVSSSSYLWHAAPDGGATFATLDGGYVYVSNCEQTPGGAGALRFDAEGGLIDAYPILQNSLRNCAGGPTPWGTWLSCEEVPQGGVWECDPLGVQAAVFRPALGLFNHEAAAVDPLRMQIYLTEDAFGGCLYRFTPAALDSTGRPDLTSGLLEAASVQDGVLEGRVTWLPIADPSGTLLPTRLQAAGSAQFNGGEGIWHHDGVLYFATKGDNRVWAYDVNTQLLTLIYDAIISDNPILTGVDNVTVSPAGDVLVAEDVGGDMQIVGLTPDGTPVALLQLVGHDGSEIAGPAFDPSGTRLYFSSQRGTTSSSAAGVTFEVTGQFFAPGA